MSIPTPLHAILETTKMQLTTDFASFLDNHTISDEHLASAIEYALLNGGKRIRPLLVNLTGRALNIAQNDMNIVSMAIECIHAYSLVHDDLPAMDDDDLRRGNPTTHIKFDEATAILAGDALQCMAFEILASLPMSPYAHTKRSALIKKLARAAGPGGMVGGQSLDLAATNKKIEMSELTQLHQLKTGALLIACVDMACLLSEQISAEERALFTTFAQHIGLAFQIQDDILDVISDTSTLGKPQGSDVLANKSTFVSLLGLSGAQHELTNQHKLALQALDNLPYNTDDLTLFADFMTTRTF